MGYYIFSQGIQAEKLKAVFGSKDKDILTTIQKSASFDNYKDFLPAGFKTSPAQALKDIINGTPFDTQSNFAYGYAVICICQALGKELPYNQEIKSGYETDYIQKCLKERFGVPNFLLEEVLFEGNALPFDIPTIDDWPLIGFTPCATLLPLKERLSSVVVTEALITELIDGEEEELGYACEHIKGIIDNINYCITHQLDLISFCH